MLSAPRRLLPLVSSLTTALLVVAFASNGAGAAGPPETIGRAVAKLKKDKALKIGYFGGSITAGAGASNSSKTSWRALTTAWFRERFPEATITEINAAIGGTGSDLGAFRCDKDLLTKDPDLVFVEFAVNDGGGEEQRVKRSMEGIVRQIWQSNPNADILFVYTTTKALFQPYAKGELPKAIGYHQAIARHYGIPEINVGRVLAEKINSGDASWETMTTDTVHPNDAGYVLYFDSIKAFLESHLADPPAPSVFALDEPLTKDPLCGAHLEFAAQADAPGWQKEQKSMAGQCPNYIAASEPGTELVYVFNGTVIGIYWLIAPDSGDIEWSIDGGPATRRSSWDKYALKSSRANYAILADDLKPGEHRLKIKVLGEKNEQSKGTWIRIGAFMVHCPC